MACGGWVAALASLIAACSTPPPDSVANRPLPGDLPGATTQLSERRLEAIHAAFAQLPPANGEQPAHPPRDAAGRTPGALRWSDLDAAVAAALLANDAALLHATLDDSRGEFTFITASALPGRVVATRIDGPLLVDVAATIDSARPDPARETAIVEAVHAKLAALGKRRQLGDL